MHIARENGLRIGGRSYWRVAGLAALSAVSVMVPGPLGANGERTISLYNVHTKETLKIAYKRNGRYLPGALRKLNWHLRDWRRNKPIKMDPALIDLVWEIHTELGSRVPVHVISGYRSPATNNMLRKTRGGQARRSQHLLGKAVDVRFPDVPVRRLRYSALLREQGGVGYYPTSATPFVHVDTGRVRHWPRMGRQELALLFPNGRTRHRPRGGRPITRSDALAARNRNPALARRVAAFHSNRRNGPVGGQTTTRIAAATAPTPRLVSRPRIARRAAVPSRPRLLAGAGAWSTTLKPRQPRRQRPLVASLTPPLFASRRAAEEPKPLPFRPTKPSISTNDRSRLTNLARALFGSSTAKQPAHSRVSDVAPPQKNEWISAPAYDDEHPEELYYRPFPIAPYITQTASADDAALRQLTHPDIDKTLELLAADGTADPPLQMRPGLQTANLMWSQSFDGKQRRQNRRNRTASTWLGRRLVQLAGR